LTSIKDGAIAKHPMFETFEFKLRVREETNCINPSVSREFEPWKPRCYDSRTTRFGPRPFTPCAALKLWVYGYWDSSSLKSKLEASGPTRPMGPYGPSWALCRALHKSLWGPSGSLRVCHLTGFLFRSYVDHWWIGSIGRHGPAWALQGPPGTQIWYFARPWNLVTS